MSVTIGEVFANIIQSLYVVPVIAIDWLHMRNAWGFCATRLFTVGGIAWVALVFY